MNHRQTKHQVGRGAFPDASTADKTYLLKNVSTLRATYQVRLLTYLAAESGKKLVIDAPKDFKPHSSLRQLMKEFPKTITIQRARR